MTGFDLYLACREVQQDIQIVCPKSLVALEVASRGGIRNPLESSADPSLQCNLDGITAKIDRAIETLRELENLGFLQPGVGDLPQITDRYHRRLILWGMTKAEHGFRDKWTHYYMARTYGSASDRRATKFYEIMSMAYEELIGLHDFDVRRDQELLDFALGLLAGAK